MKTSNKILIGIAVAILVIPISTMVFSALSGRIDYDEYMREIAAEGADLNAEDRFLSTTHLNEFNKVKLNSPYTGSLELHLVKSDEYAVKIHQSNSGKLDYDIDEGGILHLSVKNDNIFRFPPLVFLFAPDIKDVEINNIYLSQLHTEQDSLNLVLNDYRYNNRTVVAENKNLTFLHLTLNNSNWTMQGASPMFANLQTVRLDLDSSSIKLESDHYNQIIVDAKDSQFHLSPSKDVMTTVNKLEVNTFGKSSISFKNNIKIDSLRGTISDSTIVKLPYYMTKSLVQR